MVQTLSSATQSPAFESPTASPSLRLSKLHTRPPTPPRGSTKDHSLQQDSYTDPHQEVLKTITSSPESAARTKKQVNWSPWTKYHKPDDPSPLRPSRPASTAPTPLKSILKPFNPSVISIGLLDSSDQIKAYTYDSFPAMLESITQALASTERSKKLDTYVTFCNTLKAYDNNPDMKAIKNKMPLLSSFIRRDLGARLPNSPNNSGDSQLIQQAIKLLTVFVWLPELAESIDDGDAAFFIQHAIEVVKDPQSPKVVVTYFLNFLASQKFPSKILTLERADGIIQALRNIDERVTGNTVLTERIGVYQRLLSQAKAVMIVRTGDWMDNLLGAALSNNKELRQRAVHCMTEAARTIGSEKIVARSIINLFNREDNNDNNLFERITERLTFLTRNGEGVHVAQLWGIIILLLRGKPPVSSWDNFNPWLSIIQQCFNSSTVATKVAANAAWSKLIYVLHTGPELTPKNWDLLTRPLIRYLDPQNAASNSKGPRQAALSNICAFLYYNFHPSASPKQILLAWDAIVVALLEKLVLFGKHEVEDGCRILTALFDGSYQKPWSETRYFEKDPIKADEILRLDPKWVRSNSGLVLKTVETALRRSCWEGDECAVRLLWHKFTRTLADASMKEIKISTETMDAVAHILNILQKFWKEGPSTFVNNPNNSSDAFIRIITFLITTTFGSIGIFCFTEKQLALDDHNEFIAISTPSNRYSSGGSFPTVPHPPIVHLFQLFLKPFPGAELSEEYFNSAKLILTKSVEAQDSRRKKLSILCACSTVLPPNSTFNVDREAWNILATLTETALPVRENSPYSPIPASWEFKDVLKMLQWGCRYDIPAWGSLFHTFAQTIQVEQGDAHLISTVLEPLADFLRLEKMDPYSDTLITHGKAILEKAVYPKNKLLMDSIPRVSYGMSSRKIINAEPYDSLYSMINQYLVTTYLVCENVKSTEALKDFITTSTDFIKGCPKTSVMILLKRIQEGIAAWTADPKEYMSNKNSNLAVKIQNLWASITEAIRRLPRHDSMILQSLAVLVAGGLESRHKVIVSGSLKVWNDTFGVQGSLEYPPRVRIAMKKLRPVADISLPTFPEDIEEMIPTPPVWDDSQESQEGLVVDRASRSSPTFRPSRSRDQVASPVPESLSSSSANFLARLREASSKVAKPKPRLRHMDSQQVFAPIVPSLQAMIADSQLLTDHQKEVMERQHEEASAFFFGIGGLEQKHRESGQRSPGRLLDSSDSLEEFVDAIEEKSPPQKQGDFTEGIEIVPSTAFTVEVPKKTKLCDYLGDPKEPRSHADSSSKWPELSRLSSKYFIASKETGEEWKNKETCVGPDLQKKAVTELIASSPIPLSPQGSCQVTVLHNNGDAESEIIPDSFEVPQIPPIPHLEAPPITNEALNLEKEHEESVVGVVDSFINDCEDVETDVKMMDRSDIPVKPNAEEQLITKSSSQMEDCLLSEPASGTKKLKHTRDIEVAQNKNYAAETPTKARRTHGTRKRKALQIKTTSSKASPQQDEDILECIMVTPATPKKEQVLPNTQHPPHGLTEPKAPISPRSPLLSTRKRKQRLAVIDDTPVKNARKPAETPRKRRQTRSSECSLLVTEVDCQLGSLAPSAAPSPAQLKSPVKYSIPTNPDVPRPGPSRSSRSRGLPIEEIVLDSQPEVVATPPQPPGSPEAPPGHKEPIINISFITDSNAAESQSRSQEEAKGPLTRLKAALTALESAELGSKELREAEDEVFEVYLRLREQRRRKDKE